MLLLIQVSMLAAAIPAPARPPAWPPASGTQLQGPPSSLQLHKWSDGGIYPLATAPGQVSSISLEPGEKLVSIAAGDTAQWVIGDTTSGVGEGLRSHVLVKPVAIGLKSNLVITTDRRLYE